MLTLVPNALVSTFLTKVRTIVKLTSASNKALKRIFKGSGLILEPSNFANGRFDVLRRQFGIAFKQIQCFVQSLRQIIKHRCVDDPFRRTHPRRLSNRPFLPLKKFERILFVGIPFAKAFRRKLFVEKWTMDERCFVDDIRYSKHAFLRSVSYI